MDLGIVIINYRTPDLTLACLRSLVSERGADVDFHVWLVDNASGDDSVPHIREAIAREDWDQWIHLLSLQENLGFAGGNNHAVQLALERADAPRYLLLLNSDTVVRPGCLSACVGHMDQEERIGALSCQLLNEDGSVQIGCRRMLTPLRETLRASGLPYVLPRLFGWADLEYSEHELSAARDVDWIAGAFMLLRTELIRHIGLFDDGFFFYGEDVELCHRIRRSGNRVRFAPCASIVHYGGASSDSSRLRSRRRDILRWKALFRVQRMCYGRIVAWWVWAAYTSAFFLHKWYLILRGRRDTDTYEGVAEGLCQLIETSGDGQ